MTGDDEISSDAETVAPVSTADAARLDDGLGGLHHGFVLVSDLPRAVEFYATVVGAEPLRPDDPDETVATATFYWLAVGDDTFVNLAVDPERAPLAEEVEMLALGTTTEHARTVERRLEARDWPYDTGVNTLRFDDPDGNEVELTWWDGPR
ncbi:VOC family protein [Halobaculum sp. MBLA0147]|uniref:VOC family protein n=1 Tax=Halobaculum sp. MBLA0147 TaxID=3079934 RepID=UPI0035238909